MSPSEGARKTLRSLQRNKALEAETLASLRREIGIGLADAAEGRFSRQSAKSIAEEVRREHLSK